MILFAHPFIKNKGMKLPLLLTTLLFISCAPSELVKDPACEIEVIRAPLTMPPSEFYTLFEGMPSREVGKSSKMEQFFTFGGCHRATILKIWSNQACDAGANTIVVGGRKGRMLGLSTPDRIDCSAPTRARFFLVDKQT